MSRRAHTPELNVWVFCCAVYSLSALSTRADDEHVSRPELKRGALDGFSFEAPAPPAQQNPPSASGASVPAGDSDVVAMDPLRVTTTFWDKDLAADIRKTRPLKAKSEAKLGTGVYQKDFGKVRASAVTILYVPVMVGFSW